MTDQFSTPFRFPVLFAQVSNHVVWCETCEDAPEVMAPINDARYFIAEGRNDIARKHIEKAYIGILNNHRLITEGITYLPTSVMDLTQAIIEKSRNVAIIPNTAV